tara:strand:- start:2055 stop:2351 length:297 start_codon:yes stop_codon:yes gene_type:complete
MIYLLPENILNLMLKQKGFYQNYGNTYADYICNSVDLSDILEDLIYSSDSYSDALYIINYFGVKYTHSYPDLLKKNIDLICADKDYTDYNENIKLSVS